MNYLKSGVLRADEARVAWLGGTLVLLFSILKMFEADILISARIYTEHNNL